MSQSAKTYDVYLPKAKQKVLKKIAVYDVKKILIDFLKTVRIWSVENYDSSLFTDESEYPSDYETFELDIYTKLAWNERFDYQELTDFHKTDKNNLRDTLNIKNWKIPTIKKMEEIYRLENFYNIINTYCYFTIDGKVSYFNDGSVELDKGYVNGVYIYAVSDFFQNKSNIEIIDYLLVKKWFFFPADSIGFADNDYQDFLRNLNIYRDFIARESDREQNIIESWKNIDYFSVRLPVIDAPVFTDSHKGLWEFYAPQSQQNQFNKVQSETSVRGRNPALDIQHAPVAIDFGTSSTVVAIRQNGRDELLRIGIQEKDLNKAISAEQFENPTILEFLNLNEFQTSWQSEAYRPLVNWDHVHCSHEAKASLNNNKEADSKVISSIFPRLKQWALRDAQHTKVVITDQQGTEYTVQPLTEYHPVKGQAIQINQNYPELDPIELYAWFLGMNINWRGRGIFLDYYMTFPVAYPSEVKDKILASFRRGLMRSLPESLIADEQFNQFSVREWASEPAAYAAAALEKLNIEPTEQGVAYAVFDFGGGTTDFDYGIYREPNEQEEDLYDHVIEHFGASGDKFLGGENLLENLAYIVFKYNQEICRKQKVSFTKPLDAEKFIGHEQLIDDSQMAYTNTSLLMAALRPFLEKGQFADGFAGALDIKLLNRQNEVVNCQFTVKQDELLSYLKSRIYQGFVNFFVGLKQAFTTQHQALPKVIHILLAGNASRSKLVKELLVGIEKKDQTQTTLLNLGTIFGQDIPEFKIHYPLDADLKHHDVITAKTGVALGLLRLCPGEGLKVINHAKTNDDANSPFQFYVGRQKRGVFEVMIKRGDAYHQWQQIGAVSEDGIFLLLYSSLAQALTDEGMKRGATGLFDQRIRFAGNTAGQKVFARILAPSEIELCSASDLDEIQVTGGNNLQQIKLS